MVERQLVVVDPLLERSFTRHIRRPETRSFPYLRQKSESIAGMTGPHSIQLNLAVCLPDECYIYSVTVIESGRIPVAAILFFESAVCPSKGICQMANGSRR